ncbi:MAG: hypothetical protein ACOY5Y_12735 [Pseudomonadota bacterium]
MRRYILPGGLLLVAVAVLPMAAVAGWNETWPGLPLSVANWIYALGAVVWSIEAVRAKPPLWPHLIAVWAPLAAPAAVMWRALQHSDAGALGFFAFAPAIFVPLLASMLSTFLLLLRLTWSPPDSEDLPSQ